MQTPSENNALDTFSRLLRIVETGGLKTFGDCRQWNQAAKRTATALARMGYLAEADALTDAIQVTPESLSEAKLMSRELGFLKRELTTKRRAIAKALRGKRREHVGQNAATAAGGGLLRLAHWRGLASANAQFRRLHRLHQVSSLEPMAAEREDLEARILDIDRIKLRIERTVDGPTLFRDADFVNADGLKPAEPARAAVVQHNSQTPRHENRIAQSGASDLERFALAAAGIVACVIVLVALLR